MTVLRVNAVATVFGGVASVALKRKRKFWSILSVLSSRRR
jgi:hypothetical protein